MDAALDTLQKALQINLDPRWYGTIAEIGAGQEVVRWFFRVGGGPPLWLPRRTCPAAQIAQSGRPHPGIRSRAPGPGRCVRLRADPVQCVREISGLAGGGRAAAGRYPGPQRRHGLGISPVDLGRRPPSPTG